MPTVIGRHDVKDKDHWLASPKREEVFGPLGVTNIRTFVDPQNPAQVAVLMDVADLDVLMAAMQSEAMAVAMAYTACWAKPWCFSSGRSFLSQKRVGPRQPLIARERPQLVSR